MRKSKLSWYKQSRLIELFVAGSTARTAASLVGVNKTTASYYFHRLRLLIYENSQDPGLFEGEIEVDESYFGGTRNGKVYACIIPNAKADTLIPIIREKVKPDSIVYTDSFKSYNALDVSEFTHYRINHSKTFVNDKNHINGIENFWNQAKRHLRKFNGVPKEHFHLYLKECEWRFNHSDPKSQLLQLKQWVKQGLNWLSRTAPSIL